MNYEVIAFLAGLWVGAFIMVFWKSRRSLGDFTVTLNGADQLAQAHMDAYKARFEYENHLRVSLARMLRVLRFVERQKGNGFVWASAQLAIHDFRQRQYSHRAGAAKEKATA